MQTMNINLTDEQAKLVKQTSKTYGFANRSEFLRALLRYVYKTNPSLIKAVAESPFTALITKKTLPTLEEIKKKAIPVLQKNKIEFAGIFGSYARGEAKPQSDLDVLVRFKNDQRIGLFDLISIQRKLSEILGIKVDLGTEDSIDPLVRADVKKDLTILYGNRRTI